LGRERQRDTERDRETDRENIEKRQLGAGVSCNHLLEGLVNRPKPADVGAGCKKDEPEKGEAKVGGSPASDQPRETAHQVHGQRDAVHCRPRNTYTYRDRHQMCTDRQPVQIYVSTQTWTHTQNSTQTHNQTHGNSTDKQRCRHTYMEICTQMQTTFIDSHPHRRPTHHIKPYQ
jgi:hypothetical protein